MLFFDRTRENLTESSSSVKTYFCFSAKIVKIDIKLRINEDESKDLHNIFCNDQTADKENLIN